MSSLHRRWNASDSLVIYIAGCARISTGSVQNDLKGRVLVLMSLDNLTISQVCHTRGALVASEARRIAQVNSYVFVCRSQLCFP